MDFVQLSELKAKFDAEKKIREADEQKKKKCASRVKSSDVLDVPSSAGFGALCGDGVTLICKNSVILAKGTQISKAAQKIRREMAEADEKIYGHVLSKELKGNLLDPNDVVGFYKNGVQKYVYRNVRTAKYPVAAEIDLHYMSVDEAAAECRVFLETCYRKGYRFVKIIHGKGEQCMPPACLKSFVFEWLKDTPCVMAAHHCPLQHGGPGAIFAYIRKNETARIVNQEKFSS